ncbi:hypothetical protein [Salinimicrobium xinjiangense]|uniref:hypothetical protein n=1 Tax=Salinimicrobium xinjiangense TaxID=438596 RepID=UPI000417CCFC|nr:hypothetical protein [Salinimicrobium xinjiangense]
MLHFRKLLFILVFCSANGLTAQDSVRFPDHMIPDFLHLQKVLQEPVSLFPIVHHTDSDPDLNREAIYSKALEVLNSLKLEYIDFSASDSIWKPGEDFINYFSVTATAKNSYR